jgi:hypothetical protein
MRCRDITLLCMLAASACSVVNNSDAGGDETGGPDQWSEGPLEVEHPPEWVCRERAPNVTLAGHDKPIPELERCYYSPHAKDLDGDGVEADPWGWPGKPHWQGLPSVMGWLDLAPSNAVPHPIYTWYDDSVEDGVEVGYVLHQANPDHPWLPKKRAQFRSGLVSNFAFWVGGVPDSGHRPPIVTASFIDVMNFELPTIMGHPFYEGRYNAHGVPCSTTPISESSAGSIVWSPAYDNLQSSTHAECQAWAQYYGVMPAALHYPMWHTTEETMIGVAMDAAECLDNGGVYKASEAALTAHLRNGLIWINWGEFWEDFVLWIQTEHPVLYNLIVALDYLQGTGWNAWPLDPPYPYNSWSVTGVCAHPARLAVHSSGNGTLSIRTATPCPDGMAAVFPEFQHEDLDEWNEELHGYCTLLHQMPPPPGVADATPIDVITTGRKGHGFTGAKYINLSGMTQARLDEWIDALTLRQTDAGVVVSSKNRLGADLLVAFDVPEGATILSVDDLRTDVDPETGAPPASAVEIAMSIDRAVAAGRLMMLLIDTPTRRRLHRYVVPYFGE